MERSNDNLLTYAALLFILVVVGVIMAQKAISPSYSLSNDQVHLRMNDSALLVMPRQLKDMMDNGSLGQYTLIDLREIKQKPLAGIDNYLHIPFETLPEKLDDKGMETDTWLLLAGETESQAMIAANLLVSKGFNHVKVMANDAAFFENHIQTNYHARFASKHGEKAAFDYSRFFRNTSSGKVRSSSPMPTVPGSDIQVVKGAGGC